MDGVAALDKEERALLFRQAAADKGVDARVMEKDFWVCWSLKKIFALEGHLPETSNRHSPEARPATPSGKCPGE